MGRQRDPKQSDIVSPSKEARKEFESTNISLKDLSEKYSINYQTIKSWKSREKWLKVATETLEVATKVKKLQPNKVASFFKVAEIVEIKQVEEIDDEIIDDDGLTQKQRLFIIYYLIDFNAADAAIKAGYSERSAKVIGHENLTKPLIRDAIKKAINEIKVTADIERQRIINYLTRAAFSDIKDYLSFETKLTEVGYKDGASIYGYQQVVTIKPSDEVDGTLISEVQETKEGIKFKRIDPMKALELLMKYHGMLHTVVDVKHSGGVKVEHEQHYHITQEIIEHNPSFVDNIFGRNTGRSLENRSSESEPNSV
ncbi:MAG: terminase small subunit [Nostocaceae cyanobacterium]|nr:terminase small subunit [Nostocaceae cyanobacterium]